MEDSQPTVITRILSLTDLHPAKVLPPQKGYRNTSYPVRRQGGERLNVILYKQEPQILARIKQADAVSNYLAQAGFATRQSRSPIIRLTGGNATRYARVYSYLPGATIPWEAYSMKHIKLLGETMARLHTALQGYRGSFDTTALHESRQLCQHMDHYFQQAGVATAMRQKLKLTAPLSAIRHFETMLASDQLAGLPQQALHMDFVRGNILFEDTAGEPHISGIIDFEKTSRGPVVFDIARTLAFLLVDCKYKQPDKVYKYFIRSGYSKRGGRSLDGQQLKLLQQLARFYMLHDFYKFLRHNPYEYLHQNEHYVRTRDFLVQNDIIKQTRPRVVEARP